MKKQKNRWFILAASIITNLALGAGYAWSVFQTALLEVNTGWTLSETSLAFSISFAMVPVGMIICGPIVDKHGGKKVVLVAGILFGLGMFLTGFASSIIMLYLTYNYIRFRDWRWLRDSDCTDCQMVSRQERISGRTNRSGIWVRSNYFSTYCNTDD
ncbi:putative MFS-type transporter YhjX [Jeotgalibaca dankookensis]|uniref:Putative MFS-type transporter YhjX n=1 Tax=Jeotgalibaca dankookensis TaxID=708126 RepID=A0A1S6IP91_9LACT|nr:putative MFS-type transporter YhjX [Jeotgalibaca dankookensis]